MANKNVIKPIDPFDYQNLFRSSPDLYLLLNDKFYIVEASDAYCSATLVKRDDIIGRYIFDVFPDNPDDNNATGTDNLMASLNRVIKNKKADALAVQKYDIRRPESIGGGFEERYWSPNNYPIFDEKMNVKFILHRVEDVTEFIRLKQAQIKQTQYSNELKLHVNKIEIEIYQRAQEIQEVNKQLRKANEMAQDANHAKSAFLATMSHEIRTPLNGVIGMTNILLDTHLSKQQQECVETIRLSGEALLAVINDILDFSKIESGHIELESIDINLRELIDDSLEILAGQVHKKGVAIGAIVERSVPNLVIGDPARIRQVLINLLNNAAKFTDSGEIVVRVSTESENENKIRILFQITDTGIGISDDLQTRIFQPFMQGDRSTSRKYGGTGLGLALSKRIIELMGGTIQLKSKPGVGSNFYFTIEFELSNLENTPHQDVIPFTSFENMRVLCVDDSEVNLSIIKHQVSSWNMRCDTASNATDALMRLKDGIQCNDKYKLLMIDFNMPNIDGVDLIKVIRSIDEYKNTPIILLTSLGLSNSQEKSQLLGLVASLTKPVRQSKLYDTIVTLFNTLPSTALNNNNNASLDANNNEQSNVKILLAEDNQTNQTVALYLLNKLGYKADVVKNGLEVLYSVQRSNYDIILMDCQMPEMDGYMTTEFIRNLNLPKSNQPIIIAMTAHALKGDREKCLGAGMDDYISKPINIDILQKTLHHWISKKTPKDKQEDFDLYYIDINRIRDIFGNDKKSIISFFDTFMNSTSIALDEINDSIKTKDTSALKQHFHKLKGSAFNCGIVKMGDICADAEIHLEKNNWSYLNQVHLTLEQCFSQIKIEISKLNDLD